MLSENDTTQEQPEIERLAEAVCSGEITATQVDRLGALLSNDLTLCQKYLSYMHVHGSLDVYCQSMPVETLAALSGPALLSPHPKQKQDNTRLALAVSFVSLSLVVLLAWLLPKWNNGAGNVMGTISVVSSDASFEGNTDLDVGSIIVAEQTLRLKTGTMKIQSHTGVELVLEGPLSMVYHNAGRISLTSGSLFAKVNPEAIGFTVTTPESELVDLGTAFYVRRDSKRHTMVYIDRGRVEVARIDSLQKKVKATELVAGEAVQMATDNLEIQRIVPKPDQLSAINRLADRFADIRRIDGNVRFSDTYDHKLLETLPGLQDRILITPEKRGHTLQNPLQLTGLNGSAINLPAGGQVDVYMLQFNPSQVATIPPIGAVSFTQPISAVITNQADLKNIDQEISAAQTHPDHASPLRGLEADEDEINVSADGKTVTFHLDYSPPVALDQARIIIYHKNMNK